MRLEASSGRQHEQASDLRGAAELDPVRGEEDEQPGCERDGAEIQFTGMDSEERHALALRLAADQAEATFPTTDTTRHTAEAAAS